MEYIVTKTKYIGNDSETHEERFEGTAQEIAELLKLTNGMNEVINVQNITFPQMVNSEEMIKAISDLPRIIKEKTKSKDENVFTLDDIEEFKKGKMAVNCKTEELAKEFLGALSDSGFRWIGRKDFEGRYEWCNYEEDTCYNCYEEGDKELQYSGIDYFKNNGYKIKEFKGW